MSSWVFEARDRSGKPVRGTREAPDRQAALDALRAEGLFLTRLEAGRAPAGTAKPPSAKTPSPQASPPEAARAQLPAPAAPKAGAASAAATHTAAPRPAASMPVLPPAYAGAGATAGAYGGATAGGMPHASPPTPERALLRSSSKDLSLYFNQLASMIHAGTTIGQALHIMGENAPNKALRQASGEMYVRVQSGTPMSVCMESYPGMFTPLQIGMLSAGERGGFLENMLGRLAMYSERDYHLQQTVKRETFYPKALVFCAILIPAIPSLVLGGLWSYLATVGPPLLVILAVSLFLKFSRFVSPLALRKSGIQYGWDQAKLLIPVAAKVTRALSTAKFSRALAALYSAGVGPGESVRLAAGASGNEVIARSTMQIIPLLERGERMTTALESTGHFPPMVLQMMRVGEDSGALDEQLDKAADFLETDAETAIKQATVAVGILALLAVAGYIGMIVIQFWTGYFNNIFSMAESAS